VDFLCLRYGDSVDPAPTDGDYLRRSGSSLKDTEKMACRFAVQDSGVAAAGEDRREIVRFPTGRLVSDAIDATVDLAEEAVSEARLDLVTGKAALQQLPPSHDSVLAPGEPSDHRRSLRI
jgi:hypothetical protein